MPQLAKVEGAAGFTIITRTKPLTATADGEAFVSEAKELLALLDHTANDLPSK